MCFMAVIRCLRTKLVREKPTKWRRLPWKQNGWDYARKSLFVVPNHLTEQWASEFLNLYPNAKLLVARRKDFETANRKKFCARIATGDYDAVIIGHIRNLSASRCPLNGRSASFRSKFMKRLPPSTNRKPMQARISPSSRWKRPGKRWKPSWKNCAPMSARTM